jgi:hypothetical protein
VRGSAEFIPAQIRDKGKPALSTLIAAASSVLIQSIEVSSK